MYWRQIFCLLISIAVVTSSVIDPLYATNKPTTLSYNEGTPDISGSPSDFIDSGIVIEGITLDNLRQEEVTLLLNDLDTQLVTDLDLIALRQIISSRNTVTTTTEPGLRKKRALPLIGLAARGLFVAARGLFGGASRTGLSRSGTRLTQQYSKTGGFSNAMKDFNRFGIQNSKPITGKFTGQTGTFGKHRVTVRSGSSGGKPTLEIRTPKSNGEFVRKFRYEN